MNKRAGQFLLVVLLSAFSSAIQAQTYDLSGGWEAPFTIGETQMQTETVNIQQTGNMIRGTKVTGDAAVSAGTMNLRGAYNSNPFPAEQICRDMLLNALVWEPVTVTVIDEDHFKIEGGCSGDVIWKRANPAPKVS